MQAPKRAYHPDLGDVPAYRFEQLPESPDGQVAATIRAIRQYIRADAHHPFVEIATQKALELGDGDPLKGIWQFLKARMRFKQDADIAQDLDVDDPRKDETIEVLIRPADQARQIILYGQGVEDCDGYNMLGACMLYSLGIPSSLVTAAANEDQPNEFSHVYSAVYPFARKGPRIPMDFSHGEAIGWECPSSRRKEWPTELTFGEVVSESVLPVALLTGAWFGLHWLNRRAA